MCYLSVISSCVTSTSDLSELSPTTSTFLIDRISELITSCKGYINVVNLPGAHSDFAIESTLWDAVGSGVQEYPAIEYISVLTEPHIIINIARPSPPS